MLESILFYNRESILARTSVRKHEVKIGEQIEILSSFSAIKQSPAKFVLFGISEDIGIRANQGREGAAHTWEKALQTFLNLQYSQHTNYHRIALLGEVDCREEMYISNQLQPESPNYLEALGALVEKIDKKVSAITKEIISHGKVPILIGGGHNNCYGMLEGASLAKGKAINTINFDVHSDFRPLEHRHSGNGFSYAFSKGYINKYFLFGLQRNYTSQTIWDTIAQHSEKIKYVLFEEIFLEMKSSFAEALSDASTFINDTPFGVELDLDSITNIGSSAMTPSGWDLNQARAYLYHFSHIENCTYIHICEGAPKHELFPNQIGKTLAYLISDCLAK